ncbi:diguanylate cyclase domain-containing protein [Thermocrinis minervae]|uniref:diguanylate cyclase domain-containing protein n=1 Tax=Thermocrinis minervae TaxID=381751 RepID=UPI0009A87CC7|nr:diguanylate cyclase [Thermocrinis minervae]
MKRSRINFPLKSEGKTLVITNTVRESDYVVRFDGEEFLVLLMDVQSRNRVAKFEKEMWPYEEY